jgi:CRISPR-associated protein Cas5d
MSYYRVEMEIAGDTAMWTRPDTGDCPVSYPAPTYSAVKAIFESLLFGFKTLVKPIKVEICAPLQYHSYHTNYGGPLRQAASIAKGNSYQLLATVLIDVCYRLYAEVVINKNNQDLTEKSKHWDAHTTSPCHAYQDIFNRRLKRGQCYSIPSLGWKEFIPSYFGVFRNSTKVQDDITTTISSMLRQIFSGGYNSKPLYTYDQDVAITKGVLTFTSKDSEHD